MGSIIIYWGPVMIAIVASRYWLPLGIIWMLPAAVLSMMQAKKRGYPVVYYGVIGALYSLFLLLPWIYLTSRLQNKNIPYCAIVTGYALVYLYWVSLLVPYQILLSDFGPEYSNFLVLGSAVAAIVSAGALLSRRHGKSRSVAFFYGRAEHPSGEYRHAIRDVVYIFPFIMTFVHVALLVPFLFWVTGPN